MSMISTGSGATPTARPAERSPRTKAAIKVARILAALCGFFLVLFTVTVFYRPFREERLDEKIEELVAQPDPPRAPEPDCPPGDISCLPIAFIEAEPIPVMPWEIRNPLWYALLIAGLGIQYLVFLLLVAPRRKYVAAGLLVLAYGALVAFSLVFKREPFRAFVILVAPWAFFSVLLPDPRHRLWRILAAVAVPALIFLGLHLQDLHEDEKCRRAPCLLPVDLSGFDR